MADRKNAPPENTPEYMWPAWVSCLHWASGKREVVDAFERDTGLHWTPPNNTIDAAIDRATGADRHLFEQFIQWFNENIWGDPFAGEGDDRCDG